MVKPHLQILIVQIYQLSSALLTRITQNHTLNQELLCLIRFDVHSITLQSVPNAMEFHCNRVFGYLPIIKCLSSWKHSRVVWLQIIIIPISDNHTHLLNNNLELAQIYLAAYMNCLILTETLKERCYYSECRLAAEKQGLWNQRLPHVKSWLHHMLLE